MGGMHGLGPLRIERDEPLFHNDWEARVFAISLASPTSASVDAGRHRMELIPGPDYLRMSYYERWLCILGDMLVENGSVTPEELASARPADRAVKASPQLPAEAVEAAFTTPGSYARETTVPPRFLPGDIVRARNMNPEGHTRLPRYARGRCGTILRYHGAHVFPDSNAHGDGENPQPLYTVEFSAVELWGDGAAAGDSVCLDLWEPYLEPR
jgi:nitrile hydratase